VLTTLVDAGDAVLPTTAGAVSLVVPLARPGGATPPETPAGAAVLHLAAVAAGAGPAAGPRTHEADPVGGT